MGAVNLVRNARPSDTPKRREKPLWLKPSQYSKQHMLKVTTAMNPKSTIKKLDIPKTMGNIAKTKAANKEAGVLPEIFLAIQYTESSMSKRKNKFALIAPALLKSPDNVKRAATV